MSGDTELCSTLPGRAYTDAGIFADEQRRIFAKEWVYVARADDLPAAGDVLSRRVGGEGLVVVRGRDGKLRAFLNVCRHRGALLCLEEATNVGRRIRCPYHAWTYNLDGGLAGAPNWGHLSEEERTRYGLHPVALTEWGGLVWVNLADDPMPLVAQLEPQLDYRFDGDVGRVERYGLSGLVVGARRRYEVAANWKIILENFQECYHCSAIHPELVDQVPMFGSLRALAGIDGGYPARGFEFADDRPAFSLTGRAALPALPGVGDEDTGRYFGMILRPNCALSLLPDHAIVHRFEPRAPDATAVVCEWLFDPVVATAPDFDPSDTVELFDRVNRQDFAAAEWCQPNMTSKSYRDGGVLVPLEAEVIGRWFYPWYRGRMDEAG